MIDIDTNQSHESPEGGAQTPSRHVRIPTKPWRGFRFNRD